jgi:predicted lysophospholipase L1 biosynthesis ABC-type transport system permease subunit
MPLADYRSIQSLARQHAFLAYTPLVESMMTIRPIGGDPNAVEIGDVQAVDPMKYPFYDRIVETGSAGQTLAQALQDPTHILVNHALYDKLHLHPGMRVQINLRAHRLNFVVWGIAPNTAAQFIGNPYALSSFVIANVSVIQPLTIPEGNAATRVYIKTRDAAQASAVKRSVESRLGELYTVNTAADVEKQNEDAAQGLNRFMNIMGLLAVVIGGIGIVNTMLVAVRRRRKEIAVVKALGMKQGQVVGTFSLGAVVLGLTGGLVGIGLGIGASRIVEQVTQDIMANTAIEWKIRAGPLIAGMLVAIIGTVLFAFFPVQRESQVRPIAAMRDEVSAPLLTRRALWLVRLRTSGLIVALAIAGGILAGFFLDLGNPVTDVLAGGVMGIGVLLGLALLTQLFSWIVALISKMPSFRSLTLRLSFRSLGRQQRRMASILLALCVGILSVGTVTIMAQDLKSSITTAAGRDNSFNTVVFYGLGLSDMAKVHAVVD